MNFEYHIVGIYSNRDYFDLPCQVFFSHCRHEGYGEKCHNFLDIIGSIDEDFFIGDVNCTFD